jgi:hypothetical protein
MLPTVVTKPFWFSDLLPKNYGACVQVILMLRNNGPKVLPLSEK